MERYWIQVEIAVPPPSERHSSPTHSRSRPMVVQTRTGDVRWARYDHQENNWYDLEWMECDVVEWMSRERSRRLEE